MTVVQMVKVLAAVLTNGLPTVEALAERVHSADVILNILARRREPRPSPKAYVEETLYDTAVIHSFVGIDLGHEPVPDETTACCFRHLLEARDPPNLFVT